MRPTGRGSHSYTWTRTRILLHGFSAANQRWTLHSPPSGPTINLVCQSPLKLKRTESPPLRGIRALNQRRQCPVLPNGLLIFGFLLAQGAPGRFAAIADGHTKKKTPQMRLASAFPLDSCGIDEAIAC